MQRALTGVQPSGQIHLGNYLGAIQPALNLQKQHDTFYFIADYHALTSVQDPTLLRQSGIEIAATFLALGLDVEGSATLFKQSSVPEVCELAWILACCTSAGTLDKGHAVKAARDGGREINAGTVFYPVLMSADILLYGSNIVPVGRDQQQHVEIARDLATRVNHRFGEGTLVVPTVQVQKEVGLVSGTDGRKMSKSYGNTLPLWLPAKKLRKQVMRIVTDSRTVEEPKDPDTCNVMKLYKLFGSTEQIADLRGQYIAGGMGYGVAKQALYEAIDERLEAPRARYEELISLPVRVEEVLQAGAERARQAAKVTMTRVREATGLG
ncbi:MAG: tryptophan--tRNA ligase [Rhodobacterales bacterium]|nr:tryptophan--tRNA ligase [Rhodobacterales bacterium]